MSATPAIPINALLHFAAGVVWKRSVGRWKLHGPRGRKPVLGVFEEDFRRFLLGETAFPEHADLIIELPTDHQRIGLIRYPDFARVGRNTRPHIHQLAIPGVYFTLCVSRHQDPRLRESSLTSERLIWLGTYSEMLSFESLASTLIGSTPKGRRADLPSPPFD